MRRRCSGGAEARALLVVAGAFAPRPRPFFCPIVSGGTRLSPRGMQSACCAGSQRKAGGVHSEKPTLLSGSPCGARKTGLELGAPSGPLDLILRSMVCGSFFKILDLILRSKVFAKMPNLWDLAS